MSVFRTIAMAAALATGAATAHAAMLFNNIGNGAGYGFSASDSGDGPLGQSFIVGGLDSHLTDVWLSLSTDPNTPTGSIVITLNASAGIGGGPDGWITDLATVADSSLSSSGFGLLHIHTAYIPLSAGTEYWIMVQDGGSTVAVWEQAADNSGIGIANATDSTSNFYGFSTYFSSDVGNDGSALNDPFVLGIAADVPEPATLGLIGASLAALGLVRRRRRRA